MSSKTRLRLTFVLGGALLCGSFASFAADTPTPTPTDKNPHPSYTSQLFLEKYVLVPARIIFKGRPDGYVYQIDTIDVRQPTQILAIGDAIAGTKFKIIDFKEKHHTGGNGVDVDDSELTIQNTETNEKVVLVLGLIENRQDSYALFKYLGGGTIELRVKKGATFSLKPEPDVEYKLVDVNDKGAIIENVKTSEIIKIPRLQ
jgi:hypothetical protein